MVVLNARTEVQHNDAERVAENNSHVQPKNDFRHPGAAEFSDGETLEQKFGDLIEGQGQRKSRRT